MASQSYWENRMEQLYDAQDKKNNVFDKKMRKEYHRLEESIKKEIASYYTRYGKEDVIEYRNLVQSLTEKERDLLYRDYDEFARRNPQFKHLMPVRESIYKLNRLEGLQLSIRMQMVELGALEQEECEKLLREDYEKGYLSTIKGLDNAPSFFSVNNITIQQTLNERWINGGNFSSRIWGNKERLLNTLNSEIRDAIIRGDDYKQMTKIIQHRLGVGAYDSMRLAVTESTFVMNQANKQAFMDAGVERYEISAVLDKRTSPTCKHLDGEQFEFKDAKVGVNYPPFHCFCRSTCIPLENVAEATEIKNAGEARKALKDIVGFSEVEESFLGIDEALQISNTKQLVNLESKFKAIHKSFGTISCSSSSTIAHVGSNPTNPSRQNLVLSQTDFKNKEKLIKNTLEMIDSKWFMPAETIENYVVTHEYGHILQNVLIKNKMESLGWSADKPNEFLDLKKKTNNAVMKWYTKVRKDVEKSHLKEIVEIAKEKDPTLSLFDHISDYGKTNESEFFAEVFANSQLGKPNKLGDAMNIWLVRKGLIIK